MVGLTRLELVTPRLSSVCSNQLSYRPSDTHEEQLVVDLPIVNLSLRRWGDPAAGSPTATFVADFTPVIGHTVVTALFGK